jgi:predicted dehydrogenase
VKSDLTEVSEPVRVGIIGAGYMGGEYAKVILSKPCFDLVTIHSRSKQRATDFARMYNLEGPSDSISDIYKVFGCKLIIVAVPVLATKKVCEELKTYPVHVLVEKPLGMNLDESKQLSIELQDSTANFYVALNRRFYDSTLRALDYFPKYGTYRHVSIRDQQDTLQASLSGQPESVIKSWMYANSIHIIDYLKIFTCGVISKIERKINTFEKSLFLHANMEFEDGNTADYFCAWNAPGGWSVNIRDSVYELDLTPLESISVRKFPERKMLKLDIETSELKPGLSNMLNEILLELKGFGSSLVSVSESHCLMKIIDTLYEGVNVPN